MKLRIRTHKKWTKKRNMRKQQGEFEEVMRTMFVEQQPICGVFFLLLYALYGSVAFRDHFLFFFFWCWWCESCVFFHWHKLFRHSLLSPHKTKIKQLRRMKKHRTPEWPSSIVWNSQQIFSEHGKKRAHTVKCACEQLYCIIPSNRPFQKHQQINCITL